MAKRVDIGDGYIVEFPDDMSDDDIKSALQKQFPPQAKPRTQAASPMATEKVAYDAPTIAETGLALAEGAGKGAFNVGGIVGRQFSPTYEENRAERMARDPVASTLGYGGGAMGAGGVVAKGLALGLGAAGSLPYVGGAFSAAGRAIAPVRGQGVRNSIRATPAGAITGGVMAAAEGGDGGDVALGAGVGAAAGPVVAGAARGLLGTGRVLKGLVSQSGRSQQGVRVVAKRLNETPDELERVLDEYQADTGRPMTLSELAGRQSGEELKRLGERSDRVGNAFLANEQRVTSVRPGTMRDQVESLGPTDNAARLSNVRDEAFDAAMAQFGDNRVRMGSGEIQQLLGGRDALSAMGDTLRRRVAEAIQDPDSAALTVREMETIRKALSTKAGDATGPKHYFVEQARAVRDRITQAEGSYGHAMEESSRFAQGIKGYEHGRAGKPAAGLTNRLDRADSNSIDYETQRKIGVRSQLSEAVAAGEGPAITAAGKLRQGATREAAVRDGTMPDEALAIQRMGQKEFDTAQRLRHLTPATKADSEEAAKALQTVVEGALVAGGNSSMFFKLHASRRLMALVQDRSIRPGVAQEAARLLTDPATTRQGIAALRQSGLSEDRINQFIYEVISPAAGAAAGGAVQ